MTAAITETQLENAASDADSLGSLVNDGASPGTYTTRTGRVGKTLAKIEADVAAAINAFSSSGAILFGDASVKTDIDYEALSSDAILIMKPTDTAHTLTVPRSLAPTSSDRKIIVVLLDGAATHSISIVDDAGSPKGVLLQTPGTSIAFVIVTNNTVYAPGVS
jgi:hypothetical protein